MTNGPSNIAWWAWFIWSTVRNESIITNWAFNLWFRWSWIWSRIWVIRFFRINRWLVRFFRIYRWLIWFLWVYRWYIRVIWFFRINRRFIWLLWINWWIDRSSIVSLVSSACAVIIWNNRRRRWERWVTYLMFSTSP